MHEQYIVKCGAQPPDAYVGTLRACKTGSLGCKQADKHICAVYHCCSSSCPAAFVTSLPRTAIMAQVARLPFNMLSHQTVLLPIGRSVDTEAHWEANLCHCGACQSPLWHECHWAGAVATAQVTCLLFHLLLSQTAHLMRVQTASMSATAFVSRCAAGATFISTATQHSHAVASLC